MPILVDVVLLLAGDDRRAARRAARRVRPGRRTRTRLVATATMAAAAVGMAVALPQPATARPAPDRPAASRPPVGTPTPTTPLFHVVDSTGARLESIGVYGWGEQAGRFTFPHDGSYLGIVDANLPGAVHPDLRGFRRVTVDGRPGFYRLGLVQWQYAPDAWISVTTLDEAPPSPTPAPDPVESPRLRQQTLKLAAMIRTGGTAPMRVNFRIGWLPPKLVVETAQQIFPDWQTRTQTLIGFGPGGYRDPDDTSVSPLDGRSLSLYRQNVKPVEPTNTTLNGYPAYVAPGEIEIDLPDGTTMNVDAVSTRITDAQLLRIATSISYGPTLDPATWIPISQATTGPAPADDARHTGS